ncbi:MAG: nuclear transport factor 2 family protein [Chloroflexi bacterium]|nr:MAG: nuclear transport factor 2 family protein [Chloroflexota bacterium]
MRVESVTSDEIDRILERHFAAEQKRDIGAILATYTDDIEHDAVGREPNPIRGKAAIGVFSREFLNDLEHARVIPVRRLHGDAFAVDESIVEGVRPRQAIRPRGIRPAGSLSAVAPLRVP